MAEEFKFVRTDKKVKELLTGGEIRAVTVWQESAEYKFEFHNGHPTGMPIYIRPDGNTDGSNIPKFETVSKSADDYTDILDFANGPKLRKALSNDAKDDVLAVVAANWNTLVLMAKRWWTNTKPPPTVPVVRAPVDKACIAKKNCKGRVPIYEHGAKGMCNKCFAYQ